MRGLTTPYGSLGQPINKLSARGMVTEYQDGWYPVPERSVSKESIGPMPKYKTTVTYVQKTVSFSSCRGRTFLPRYLSVGNLKISGNGWKELFKSLIEYYLVSCWTSFDLHARNQGKDNHWLSYDPGKLRTPYLVPNAKGIYVDLSDYENSEYCWRIKHVLKWRQVSAKEVKLIGLYIVKKFVRIEE